MTVDKTGRHSDQTPLPIKLTKEGKLQIGDQLFNVQIAGINVHDKRILRFVETCLNKSLDSTALTNALQQASKNVTHEKIHIKPNQSGASLKLAGASEQIPASSVQAKLSTDVKPSRFGVITQCRIAIQKIKSLFSDIKEATAHAYKVPLLAIELEEVHTISPIVSCDEKNYANHLTRLFLKRGYSEKQVDQAFKALFEEPHMDILPIFEQKLEPQGVEKSMADLLQEPGNETLRKALLQVEKKYSAQTTSNEASAANCERDLRLFILCNLQRNPKILEGNQGTHFVQTISQGKESIDPAKIDPEKPVAKEALFHPNCGWPSEADKGAHAKHIHAHNTNLGHIKQYKPDGSVARVVVGRSGKSDNPERLQELVISHCIEQLSSDAKTGLTPFLPVDGCDTYIFQHMITSYLDPSFLKAVPEYLLRAVKDPEDESAYLSHLLKSLDNWKEVDVWIEKKDAPNGRVRVTLKKPIILDQLFSTTLRGIGTHGKQIADLGQAKSDKINFVGNAKLLELFIEKYEIKDCNILTSNFPKDFFQTSAYTATQAAVKQFLLRELENPNEERRLLAQSLYALFFRKDPKDNEELHAADIEIWRNIAAYKLNISQSKQCKSGTDRTIIGVALAVAQQHFRDLYNKEFIPANPNQKELDAFKKKFTEVIKEFGLSFTTETKGHFGLRWGGGVPIVGGVGNPVALKYLEAGEAITSTEKYEGKLVSQEKFYGKTDDNVRERLDKALDELTPDLKNRVKDDVTRYLSSIGAAIPIPFLSSNLELLCHIHELGLDQAKIDRINNDHPTPPFVTPKQEKLVQYVLHRIVLLWQENEKVKNIHKMIGS